MVSRCVTQGTNKLDLVLKSHGPVFIISWSLVEAMIVSL